MKKWLVVIILFSGVIAVSFYHYKYIFTAYANFFIATKGGAYGKQKIIPLSTIQFSSLLKQFVVFINRL